MKKQLINSSQLPDEPTWQECLPLITAHSWEREPTHPTQHQKPKHTRSTHSLSSTQRNSGKQITSHQDAGVQIGGSSAEPILAVVLAVNMPRGPSHLSADISYKPATKLDISNKEAKEIIALFRKTYGVLAANQVYFIKVLSYKILLLW